MLSTNTQSHRVNPIIISSTKDFRRALFEEQEEFHRSKQTSMVTDSMISYSQILNTEGMLDRDEDDEIGRHRYMHERQNKSLQDEDEFDSAPSIIKIDSSIAKTKGKRSIRGR
jgi:hypothetical protein